MTDSARSRVRGFIEQCLQARDDGAALDDGESLFLSGRLDSLTVTRLVVFLEENFGVDFGVHMFDLDELDSVEQITQFLAEYAAA